MVTNMLPSSWATIKIGDIADVKGGKRVPTGLTLVDERTQYPYIRVVDFKNNSIDLTGLKYATEQIYNQIKRYTVAKDDIYISIAGTLGTVGIVPDELNGSLLTENAAKIVITDKANVVQKFLMFTLNSTIVQGQIEVLKGVTGVPKLGLNKIEQIEIQLPTVPEQRKIAAILTAVDDAITATQRIIDQSEVVKRGLMQQLLTKGIGHTTFKQTEIGEIPTTWNIVPISHVVNLVERPMKMEDERGYQLVTVKRRHGGVVPRARLFGKDILVKSQFYIKAGDLLISKRQIVHGACEVVPNELDGAIVSNEYHTLLVNSNLDMDYFKWCCRTPMMMKYFLVSSIGVHIEKMLFKLDDWLKRKISLPPLEEQREVARVLTQIDLSIGSNRHYLDKLSLLKSGLLQVLLTGKVRVNVDESVEVPV